MHPNAAVKRTTAAALAAVGYRALHFERTSGPAVGALLVGGKSDCEFTRFRCVAEGSHRVWKATDTWRGVVDDEADEVVGEIRLADGGAPVSYTHLTLPTTPYV